MKITRKQLNSIIKEELRIALLEDSHKATVHEDEYGEIPHGKEMLYSRPGALSAVKDIATNTSCPTTRSTLMQVIDRMTKDKG